MSWFASNVDLVVELAVNHLRLSILPIVLGFVIAVPLGRLAAQNRLARGIIISTTSLLYTIPSLPLFVILPVVLGTRVLSDANLIVALTIYAVAIMARSAADSFSSVPEDLRQASDALGYSPWGRFWAVELPLAGPVLLAGLRVVSVSTVALVSVGVLIGSENLGYLFTNGKQRGILEEVGTGIVATVVLALILDVVLLLLGRLLLPWAAGARGGERRMRTKLVADPGGSVQAA